ncbi:hypothetical protein FRC11_000150 [Ceratobasidium sp. 423]|nr:hypothetical protein FRC11_000150 [Ceratobasidium sp. 423]
MAVLLLAHPLSAISSLPLSAVLFCQIPQRAADSNAALFYPDSFPRRGAIMGVLPKLSIASKGRKLLMLEELRSRLNRIDSILADVQLTLIQARLPPDSGKKAYKTG